MSGVAENSIEIDQAVEGSWLAYYGAQPSIHRLTLALLHHSVHVTSPNRGEGAHDDFDASRMSSCHELAVGSTNVNWDVGCFVAVRRQISKADIIDALQHDHSCHHRRS